MTHQDLKVVAYYAMSSYATHKKKEMSAEQFFKVRSYVKTNKNASRMMKNLQKK